MPAALSVYGLNASRLKYGGLPGVGIRHGGEGRPQGGRLRLAAVDGRDSDRGDPLFQRDEPGD